MPFRFPFASKNGQKTQILDDSERWQNRKLCREFGKMNCEKVLKVASNRGFVSFPSIFTLVENESLARTLQTNFPYYNRLQNLSLLALPLLQKLQQFLPLTP